MKEILIILSIFSSSRMKIRFPRVVRIGEYCYFLGWSLPELCSQHLPWTEGKLYNVLWKLTCAEEVALYWREVKGNVTFLWATFQGRSFPKDQVHKASQCERVESGKGSSRR